MKSQKPKTVTLKNAHYLKAHASWLYCDMCNKTVAYLCYVTYSYFLINFICKCGNHGAAENIFDDVELEQLENGSLKIKPENKRFCCENDDESLFSVVPKNLFSIFLTTRK